MNLDEVIRNLIATGEKDPLTVARKAIKRHGQEWAAAELAARAEELIADLARQRLAALRRSAEVRALALPDVAAQAAEMKQALVAKWVDGRGYVRISDLTAADCRVIAAHYRTLARQDQAKADLYEGFADLLERTGAGTLGAAGVDLALAKAA